MEEVRLMKGNEALALAAIRYGCDGTMGLETKSCVAIQVSQ